MLAFVPLDHVHIFGLFEFGEMRPQVPPGEAGLLEQIGGIGALHDKEVGQDGEPRWFVNQPVNVIWGWNARHLKVS